MALPLPEDVSSLEELLHFADRFQAGKYLTIASLTFLIYDHILTLPEEVEYIWRSRPILTIAKCLFYIIRYLTPTLPLVRIIAMVAPSPDLCAGTLDYSGYASIFCVTCIEAVLMMRVWALYAGSRVMTVLFGTICVVGITAGILIVRYIGISGEQALSFLIPVAPASVTGCARYGSTTKYFYLYIIAATVECTVFGLTITKALSYSKEEKTPIIQALVNHGCAYFAVVFVGLTLTIISFMSNFLAQPFMNSNLSVSIGAMACSRLMLSLRGVYNSVVNSPGFAARTATSTEGSFSIRLRNLKSKTTATTTTTTTGISTIGQQTLSSHLVSGDVATVDQVGLAERGYRPAYRV